jgi:hypothetical protein
MQSKFNIVYNCCCSTGGYLTCYNPCCKDPLGITFSNLYCEGDPDVVNLTCDGETGDDQTATWWFEKERVCTAAEEQHDDFHIFACRGSAGKDCGGLNGTMKVHVRWTCFCPPE